MARAESNEGCGCAEGNSESAKLLAYEAMLDRWWPVGVPFPPMAPWLAAGTTRHRLTDVIKRFQRLLPEPPPQSDELGFLATLIGSYLGVDSPQATGVLLFACAKDDPEEPCDDNEHGNWNAHCEKTSECPPATPYCTATTDSCGKVSCMDVCTADPECGSSNFSPSETLGV